VTTIRTIAVHEVVRAQHPRELTEKDEIGMAVGKAIDETLSHGSHEFAQGRRPTRAGMNRRAEATLDEELGEADLTLPAAERDRHLAAIDGVIQAFRRSELMGLPRPRSRLILINGEVGVYAQPDYWNGRDRIYEMKSFHASPIPPYILLQVQLFQCAFAGFRAFLAWFDRHAAPVSTTIEEVPALRPESAEEALRFAYRHGRSDGVEKVLEYMDSPTVRYSVPIS
jgi:hypothetical protein